MTPRRIFVVAAMLAVGAGTLLVAARPAYAASAVLTKVTQWSTGYEGRFTITNHTSAPVTSWNVRWSFPAGTTLGAFWDASVSTSGTPQRVSASNRSFNGGVAPGASVSFGFIAIGRGDPASCTVNGAPCGGDGPTTAD